MKKTMRNKITAAIIAALCVVCIVSLATACTPTTGKDSQGNVITDDKVPLQGGTDEQTGTEQQPEPTGEPTEQTGTEQQPEPAEQTDTEQQPEPAGEQPATDQTATQEPEQTQADEPAQVQDLEAQEVTPMAAADPEEIEAGEQDDAEALAQDEAEAKAKAEAEEQARAEAEAKAKAEEEEQARAEAEAKAKAEAEAKAKAEAAFDLNERVYSAPVKSGVYIIRFLCATSKVLEAAGNGVKNGTNVQINASNNGDAQAWYFKIDARGLYTIINMKSNLALHASGAGTKDGTNIVLYQQNNSNAQKFIIQKNGNGYEIIPIYSKAFGIDDLSIEVKNGKAVNKTNVQLGTSDNGTAQKFTFSNVTSRYNNPTKAVQVMTEAARSCAAKVDVERFCFSNDTLAKAYNLWYNGQSPKRYLDSYTQNVKLVYSDAGTALQRVVDPVTGKISFVKVQKPAQSMFFRYTYNKKTINNMVTAQNKVEKILIARAKKIKDPVKRARYLHDWIATNVKYDYKASNDSAWTTYAAAVKKSSRCLGYATLYRNLCNKAGLNCSVVVGRTTPTARANEHAWNKIVVKGKTYYVDTCWDVAKATKGKAKKAATTYFMKTAAWMKKHKHIL